MSYLTQLQQHNTDLQACIDKANTLPDAGNGGGSIETCSVTITFSGGAAGYAEANPLTLKYSKVTSSGLEYAEHIINSDNVTISDIAKNSAFLLYISDYPSIFGGSGLDYTGLTYLQQAFNNNENHYFFFTSSSTGAITIS